MKRGRPPDGPRQVDRLDGPEESKLRLQVILETLGGECTVAEACARLGISESRFHQLRQLVLESALAGLQPGRPGRPPQIDPETVEETEQLKQRVTDLEIELQAARVRTEIALTMPHLLQGKKNETQAKVERDRPRKRRRRRR